MSTYTATFTPEAWVNDNAIEVDPEGPTTWDCTRAVLEYADYFARVAGWRGETFADDLGVLDNDDVLIRDPDAPAWVRDWRGPFSIRVTLD